MLAGAARGGLGSKGVGGPVRSSDVDTQDVDTFPGFPFILIYVILCELSTLLSIDMLGSWMVCKS